MFGAILLVGEQFLFQPLVCGLVPAASTRASKGAHLEGSILHSNENLGGCPKYLQITLRNVEHIRRWIHRSQNPIDLEGIGLVLQLEALRELVASAVGFDQERGDVITIKSMAFEPITATGSEANSGFLAGMNLDLMSIVQLVVLALVALVLGLFVLRPLLSGGRGATAGVPALAGPGETDEMPQAATEDAQSLPSLTGEIADFSDGFPDLPVVGGGTLPSLGTAGGMGPVFGDDDTPEDPAERLRNLIGERQEETVEILRSWLENREENA